jgi:hypothetical protein
MAYAKHLFISYAHIDDEPLGEQQLGWISRFHRSLSKMLGMRLGRPVEIWRDESLEGIDVFPEEIVAQLASTELMVSVISPRYVESPWCTREIREFCKAAEKSGGLVFDRKSRAIKVFKLPIDSEEVLPEAMKQSIGYPFYVWDEHHVPVELDPMYGPEYECKYNRKIAQLAYDVAQFIKKVEAQPTEGQSGSSGNAIGKQAVYLAECGYEHRDDRDAIESELRLQGYVVYPDQQLPHQEESYVAEVRRLLAHCQLAVHIVGSRGGFIPDGPSEKPAVVLQNELAVEQSKAANLKRLIWLPHGTRSDSPAQQAFIDSLLQDPQAQFGADLITGTKEELKGVIRAALQGLETPRSPVAARTSESRWVYVICDERDRKATIPLRKYLKSLGIESELPAFEGEPSEVRQSNAGLLASCDAVLLFYGAGDEAWKRTIELELRKASGCRASNPWLGNYTYLSEPATVDKLDLIEVQEPNLINGLGGFADQALSPLLRTLQSNGT